MTRLWKSYGLAALGGAMAGLCWLPLGLAPLFPIAYFLAMRGLRRASTGGEAAFYGLVFGAARYAVASHFLLALVRFSPLGIGFYLLAILFILPYGLLEAWGAWWLEKRIRLPRSVGFGMLYTLLEWVRTFGDLSFPADLLAHGFGTDPAWLSWSPWIGSFGVTLLVMAAAVLLDLAWEMRRRRPRAIALAAVAVALWLGPVLTDLAGPIPAPPSDARSYRIGIVQPSITVADKFDRQRRPATWNRLERLTLRAAVGADLVLWPESARPEPLVLEDGKPLRDHRMEALARKAGVPILYGCEIARMEGRRLRALHNGAAIVYPDGRPGDWYGKQRLLPFAEAIPFARWFGYDPLAKRATGGDRSILTMLGNFSPGPRPTIFEVEGMRIGILICYEGMYPELSRRYRLEGANTLVILTNDSWWGRSAFAPWHARMAASVARELEVPVVRAANSGVSSSTGPDGRMRGSTALFEVTVLEETVTPRDAAETPYTRLGNLPVWAIFMTVAAYALRAVSGSFMFQSVAARLRNRGGRDRDRSSNRYQSFSR